MQGTFSTLLKGAKVLKSAGTVSDKFNSLGAALQPDQQEVDGAVGGMAGDDQRHYDAVCYKCGCFFEN